MPYRNKIKPTKEERIFVNKGPSRFLKTHAVNSQEETSSQTQSSAPQIQIYEDNSSSQNTPLVTQENALKSKISFVDILPYVFIVIGIILGILLFKGII